MNGYPYKQMRTIKGSFTFKGIKPSKEISENMSAKSHNEIECATLRLADINLP